MRNLRSHLAHFATVVVFGTLEACAPRPVEPAPKTGAAVAIKPLPAAGTGLATRWVNGAMTIDPADTCPHDKEKLEAAMDLKEPESCPTVRKMEATVAGDGDSPIGPPIAPHCYTVGNVIVVAQYEEVKTSCTRLVGLAVLPRK